MSGPKFASAFLSHSSCDKKLVRVVAENLVQRGILAWLDEKELALGSLSSALKQAVQEQSVLIVFLSENSIKSDWCQDEIRWAIEAQEGIDHLLPVYIGNPLALVKQHGLLSSRFLHKDGDRVNQLGVLVDIEKLNNATDDDLSNIADDTASQIAEKIYSKVVGDHWSEVAIFLDHRGNGQRKGFPKLPHNIASEDIPVLTFQPDLNERRPRDTLVSAQWDNIAKKVKESLNKAFEVLRDDVKAVRILGNAQTSLFWLLGKHFDRTTSTNLFCYGMGNLVINNKNQIRTTPISGGTPFLEPTSGNLSESTASVTILIGLSEIYIKRAQRKLSKETPLICIPSPEKINESEEVLTIVRDIAATARALNEKYHIEEMNIIWTTVSQAAALAAANLESHLGTKIKYLEWDHDNEEYLHLTMPDN